MIRQLQERFKKVLSEIKLFSLEVFVLLALFTIALTTFIIIARMVFEGKTRILITGRWSLFLRYVTNVNTDVMQGFTFLGTHTFLIPANLFLPPGFYL